MSGHYDTQQECPKCGIHHDTDDHFCDGLSASTCSDWKAINDDALDGQMRILTDGKMVMIGAWEETAWGGMAWFGEDSKMIPMQPTMWIPLPDPPNQNSQADQP